MAMKNANAVARKWAERLGAATKAITDGVNAVTESPTAKAAQRIDAQVEGVRRAAASGKTQRGLNRVTLADWKQAFLSKGVARVGEGATKAVPKMDAFMQQWLQHEEALASKLAAIPRGSMEQNKQRMIAAMEHNASFVRTA